MNQEIDIPRRPQFGRDRLLSPARWSLFTLTQLAAFFLPGHMSADEVVLEDRSLLVAFDSSSGALVRMENKSTKWVIERRPDLAVSFRLHAPLPVRRDNFVLGEKQRATRVERISDRKVRIQWRNLVSEHGGVLPMTFTASVTLDDGALSFDGRLVNDSPLMVETLEFPCLGDLNPPSRAASLTRRNMFYAHLESHALYPKFENDKGYWGVDWPTQTCGTNKSLFCLIQSEDQGIYAGMLASNPRYYLQYAFDERPGNLALPFDGAAPIPLEEAISGVPVHLEFRAVHFIFAQPRSTVDLAPVVLSCYGGDWHAGVDLYRKWRATWFKAPHVPAWALDVHAWQQLQINSPEEEFRIPYRELPKVGDECAANDVAAIQLVGWNHGGQDRGNPSQDVDPGLGTWAQLHDAIARIQSKGVKVILFGKFVWADISTERYRRDLNKYAIKDPYGDPLVYEGYSYHTPTQLAGINNRRFAMMCPLSATWRDIETTEFRKLLALGAAGWLYDEVLNHGTALYCFDSSHGHPAPEYVYAGDAPMYEALHREADSVNPDFLFAGEAPSDALLQYYPFSYIRIRSDSVPVARYIDPTTPLMAAVAGFDDRETLNLILMDRYVISYEPYFFKGRLGDFPLTLGYGRKIDSLRRRYRAWLWDAEFRDTLGAAVHSDGQCRYSVFRTAAGKRAVVVVNMETAKAIAASVDLTGAPAASLVAVTPESPDAVPTDGRLQIPARSAAVMLER
jgi:hypothetical protein